MLTAGNILEKKKKNEIVSVAPDTSLHDTVKLMNRKNVGCILVMDKGKIKGLWTERDLLKASGEKVLDLKSEKIKDHMETDIHYASYRDNVFLLMDLCMRMKLRHLPVMKSRKYIGMLSMRDIIQAMLKVQNKRLKEMNSMVGWGGYHDVWND